MEVVVKSEETQSRVSQQAGEKFSASRRDFYWGGGVVLCLHPFEIKYGRFICHTAPAKQRLDALTWDSFWNFLPKPN